MAWLVRVGSTLGILTVAVLSAVGVLMFPPSIAIALILGGAVGLTVGMSGAESGKPQQPGRHALHQGLRWGAATAVGCLSVVGLVVAIGPAAGYLLLVVPVVIAAVLLVRRGRVGHTDLPIKKATAMIAEVIEEPLEPAEPLHDLATEKLCLLWRRSYTRLQHTSNPTSMSRTAALRQDILDELERRDSDGFERWLGSGARAGSNPNRYLTGLA